MTPEREQKAARASVVPGSKAVGSKPRAGVPAWRTGKPDAVLAEAVDVARTAVEGIAPAWQVGTHIGARSEGDRLVTHLFESKLPGYQGWQWYAVLTRNSRSKTVTVNELGLLPSEDSILAPAWVPWADRVRPEDAQDDAQDDARGQDTPDAPAGEGSPEDSASEPADDSAEEPADPDTGSESDTDAE